MKFLFWLVGWLVICSLFGIGCTYLINSLDGSLKLVGLFTFIPSIAICVFFGNKTFGWSTK